MLDAKIISKTISDFSLHIKNFEDEMQLHAEINVTFGTPKESDSRTGLIHAVLELKAEDEEVYQLLFVESMEAEFEERPDDFQRALHEFFETKGIMIVSDDLDKALEGLGKPPMQIKNTY